MFSLRRLSLSALVCGVVLASSASATVITFETLPTSQGGGTPSNDQALTGSYLVDGTTVTFTVDEGSGPMAPVFEQVGQQAGESGGQDFGFLNRTVNGGGCPSGSTCPGIDTASPGFESQLGDWFLRSTTAGAVPELRIQYADAMTITSASGEIWDIEQSVSGNQTEQWRVRAFDSGDGLLGTDTSPPGDSPTSPLDGRPWVFSFDGVDDSTGGIDYILIDYVGTIPGGASPPTVPPGPGQPNNFFIGLAFNNFSATSVIPEPSTFALTAGGLSLLALSRRRRRKSPPGRASRSR